MSAIRVETTEHCTLYLGDCLDVLPTLGKVDHVISDPPYDEKTHRGAVTTHDATKDYGVSFSHLESPESLARTLLDLSERWVILFCAVEQIGGYATGAGASWVRAGVWDKIAPSPQITGDRPGQAVEGVAIMHRPGRKRWNRGGGAGIWRCLPEHGDSRPNHPTPKPVRLMRMMVEDFTDATDLILDPFMGSGTTGVACVRTGRRFIGIEKEPKYFEIALKRIREAERMAKCNLFKEPKPVERKQLELV